MPSTEWIADDYDEFTKSGLWRALTSAQPLGPVLNPPGCPIERVNGGIAKGRLAGGNLCLIAALNGTSWEIDGARRHPGAGGTSANTSTGSTELLTTLRSSPANSTTARASCWAASPTVRRSTRIAA